MDFELTEKKIIAPSPKEQEIKTDTENLMNFRNQLDTILLTHHSMGQDIYKALVSLKEESKKLYDLISANDYTNFDMSLAKLNVFYYEEYIKLLRGYFDSVEKDTAANENLPKIMEVTEKMKAMIVAKQEKFQHCSSSLKEDLDFFLKQIDRD